jgi:hypothetical protein
MIWGVFGLLAGGLVGDGLEPLTMLFCGVFGCFLG